MICGPGNKPLFPQALSRPGERLTSFLDGAVLAALNEGRCDLRRQAYCRQLVGKDWGMRMLKAYAVTLSRAQNALSNFLDGSAIAVVNAAVGSLRREAG